MRPKPATRDLEMSWLLFEAADTKMMLVRKTKAKRKAPRSPSTGLSPSSPLPGVEPPPPTTAKNNNQQLYASRAQTTLALPVYESPPPPYSHPPVPPKDTCLKSFPATTLPPCPPPRPPELPLLPAPALKSPWWSKRSHNETSSTDVSKPAANPVQVGSQNVRPNDVKASAPAGSGSSLEELISSKLDAILTSIDGESFSGDEKDLDIYEPPETGLRGGWGFTGRQVSQSANRAITSTIIGTNYFSKANLYTNSRLPPNLPELKLYMPSYPLLCLAAQYSQKAYIKPTGKEREAHVDANWKMGTKAMVIKSVPIDDMNTIVFAIRGSQTFMDWAVNLNSAPVSPGDFLDDPGNLCHSGFLTAARRMIAPVSSRLRSLLQEDPSRSTSSLLITGHSAGGAIASLLYAHMLSRTARSELTLLSHCFKRIHCLTFGTPPVSLLPLMKPQEARLKKNLFLSFINEGDPVPRADRAYIRSLLSLYASPAPGGSNSGTSTDKALPVAAAPPTNQKCTLGWGMIGKRPKANRASSAPAAMVEEQPKYVWKVPPGTLSNAGTLVVLRGVGEQGGAVGDEDVRAEITCDEEMRGVVFGDPVMHMMKLYARRIEVLATKAVTARVWG